MVTDRQALKRGMRNPEESDPQLEAAKGQARSLQSELAQYRHEQTMRSKELGWLGAVFGGEKNSPTAIAALAFMVTVLAFAIAHTVIATGFVADANIDRFASAADKCLAIATLALGYVCGKAGR